MYALVFAAAAAVAAQGGHVVGLAVQPPVGLTDEEIGPIKDKISDEFSALGIMVVHADALDPTCAPDPACVEQTRAGLPEAPSALLVIEMLRIGPVLQLTATATAGELRATGSHGLDEAQIKKGPLLPADVRAWAKQLASQHSAATPTDTPPTDTPPTDTPPSDTPPASADEGGGLSAMRSGALFALGVGAVAIAAGAIVAGTQDAVLGDPASTGDDKEGARTLGLVGLGVLAVGIVGVGAGAALFLLE
jgi:hypothetical protein